MEPQARVRKDFPDPWTVMMVNQERLKKQEKTSLVLLQPLVTWSLPVVCQFAHGILTVGGLKAFGFVQLNQVRYSC